MNRSRVVCIGSGKGGTGKSIVSTNLAAMAAARGERVVLIDFDAGLANDHLLLGLSPLYDLGHVMNGEAGALQALAPGPGGLRLLCGGVGKGQLFEPTRRDLERLFRALEPLEQAYDLILIDFSAGLSYASAAMLASASTVLLVASHEVTALSDAYAIYKRALMNNPDLRAGLVLNRVPGSDAADSAWERFRSVSERFLGKSPQLVAYVPDDPAVSASVEARTPVCRLYPESPAAQALAKVLRWDPLSFARGPRGFFEGARRALR